jgi:hypothetical protein
MEDMKDEDRRKSMKDAVGFAGELIATFYTSMKDMGLDDQVAASGTTYVAGSILESVCNMARTHERREIMAEAAKDQRMARFLDSLNMNKMKKN